MDGPPKILPLGGGFGINFFAEIYFLDHQEFINDDRDAECEFSIKFIKQYLTFFLVFYWPP